MVIEDGGEALRINMCKRCYKESLDEQGKQLLKLKEWRGCGKKGSSWKAMEDFQK